MQYFTIIDHSGLDWIAKDFVDSLRNEHHFSIMEIDCEHQPLLVRLSEQLPQLKEELQVFVQIENWSRDKRHRLINLLVQQLLENNSLSTTFSEEIQRIFPHYFLSFIHRLFSAVNVSKKVTQQISIKQRFLILLAELIIDYPSLHTLTENHLLNNDVSLIEWKEESPKKKFKSQTNNFDREKFYLLLGTLRLLLFSTIKFDEISTWKWEKIEYLWKNSSDESIRWLSFLCFAIVSKMSLEQFVLSRMEISSSTMFKIYELIRPKRIRSFISSKLDDLFVEDDFKKRTIFIDGIPLAKSTNEKSIVNGNSIRLTRTATIEQCLRNLSLSVALNWTTFISGRISNGKTLIVEYLAEQMSKRLIKIQCSDHMDSKVLLGTYQCTDKPGEFIWTPGLFVEATSEGHWLLMEDIDAATSDVLSMIKTLIETKSIGQERISADFRLFLTYRDTNVPMQSNELIHLLKNLFCVVIPPYTDEEILQIMENLPIWNNDLKLFQQKLFEFYRTFSTMKSSNSTRLVTLRDLLKCCRRLSNLSLSNSIDRQLALNDVIDCFVSFHPKIHRISYLQSIGTLFNLNQQEVEYFALKFTPEINEINSNEFSIGQIKLKIEKKNLSNVEKMCFAKTRTSLFMLERIARCVQMNEPVLLSGETGGGKTTLVQYLAEKTGNRLHVINLSQQSDAVDLLGGYKPFDSILLVKQIYQDFLFEQTNRQFIDDVQQSIQSKHYQQAVKLMIKYTEKDSDLQIRLIKLRQSMKRTTTTGGGKSSLLFRFVEGSLVQALRNGDWILLDEINLASAETLQLLNGILESDEGTIWLAERGDKQPINRHRNFRLFGCMNPASDIGKRDIPIGIRNRFTEFFLDECDDRGEFLLIVDKYLHQTNIQREYLDRIVTFYFDLQNKVKTFQLTSSTNRTSITYSLRTLCRALKYINSTQWTGKSYSRVLFEAFSLSFFSQLDRSFYHQIEQLIHQIILKGKPSIEIIRKTSEMIISEDLKGKYLKMKSYFVLRGDEEIYENPNYIFTPTVEENLLNIIRILSAKSYPILLQGETSVGKTSLIHWLADATGNKCVRINNHEHTDLSEYLGTYTCSSVTGQLIFQDGPLIKAMRYGWWIILDELNLASSDILEALNRLLDDNRQLFLSETNELINAHERFQLFATQNPAGEQYAGRKRLSRAFRNRFIELHFDNLPQNELETIIERKCQLPKSYSKLLIQTMIDLQKHRSQKGIFAGKSSLITLRDLFRWAQRYTKTNEKCENYKQYLGEHGYLLLAGRSRSDEDRQLIKEILEKYFCEKSMSIDEDILFGENGSPFSTRTIWKEIQEKNSFEHIVWTKPLRRLAILTGLAVRFDEPTLLVGETGCGKTTICQILSKINEQKLYSVNCHTTTESADFLGSIRPVRDDKETKGLFEWQDGPLICSMKEGAMFLIDEISLADDSVLERLNSVLEPEKQLILAEKGYENQSEQIEMIRAEEKFRLIGTMNPGGDFGKKELSPALRNRFTEIWCTPSETTEDFYSILQHNLHLNENEKKMKCIEWICQFIEYLRQIRTTKRILITVRDLLSWSSFINSNLNNEQSNWIDTYEQGAYLVFLDAMENSSSTKISTIDFLQQQIQREISSSSSSLKIEIHSNRLHLGSYSIECGENPLINEKDYSFSARTTLINIQRLLRAMQLKTKPILIEGNPGVGKTSLVMALAKLSGHSFIRINLSEQTDISDLFGSDLPDLESEEMGKFRWHDGPLLTAIKKNQWIILDELNLANQSVLEGLNACLDHRGEIFIPELNRTFFISDEKSRQPLRIFACQNPYGQVSGRKGLPKSFLNRFTTIYFSLLQRDDLKIICENVFHRISSEIIEKILDFHDEIRREFRDEWEFNLRDLFKWCQIVEKDLTKTFRAFHLIYSQRMRSVEDKKRIEEIFLRTTNWKNENFDNEFYFDSKILRIGSNQWQREQLRLTRNSILLLRHQLDSISSIFECLIHSWPILLVGSAKNSSKTTLIEILATLCGHQLNRFQMNSSIDTNELLGNYEQQTSKNHQGQKFVWIESILIRSMRQGHWLILENVNRCSISVLDRLNSLLENERELILNETGGNYSTIKAHRDFRLILTMDPEQGNGEISRAMRNRCCELFLSSTFEFNQIDLKEILFSSGISSSSLSNELIRFHQILSSKSSTFSFEHFLRSAMIFNELKTKNLDERIRLTMKISYRTLNYRLNIDFDHLIDEFPLKIIVDDDDRSIVYPTKINDLCLQPELIHSLKSHQQLWLISSKENLRQFQILFYRFIEKLRFPSIEIDLFLRKKSDEKRLIDIFHRISSSNEHFYFLLRLFVEIEFLSKKNFLIFNETFWSNFTEFISMNEDEQFDNYRLWRSFVFLLESKENSIDENLRLFVLWPDIRSFFLRSTSINDEFRRFDEQILQIQNDFRRFYLNYRQRNFPLVKNIDELTKIRRRNEIYSQIDLFRSNQSIDQLIKRMKFWNENEEILGQLIDENEFDRLENLWKNFHFDSISISIENEKEKFFVEHFRSIVLFRYEWIRSFLYPISSKNIWKNSLKIPLGEYSSRDEHFSRLISLTKTSPIEELFRCYFSDQEISLIRFFNLRTRRSMSFGFVGKIVEETKFWSKFFVRNGSFLQSNRTKFIDENLTKEFLDEQIFRLEQVRPRGQIDPILYERIRCENENHFRKEIRDEFSLRCSIDEQNEFFVQNSKKFFWKKQFEENQFEQIQHEENFRFSNEIYQNLIEKIHFQLYENLIEKNFLFNEIFLKKEKKIYQQWRTNLVELFRSMINDETFVVYRDISIPIFKEIFQIIFRFDFYFDEQIETNRTNFLDFQHFQRDETRRSLNLFCQILVVHFQLTRRKSTKILEEILPKISKFFNEEKIDVKEEEEEIQRYFPSFEEEEEEEKTSSIDSFVFYEYFRSILFDEKLSFDELYPRLINSFYHFDERSTNFLDDFLNLTTKIGETLEEYFHRLRKPFDIYHDGKSSMIIECFHLIDSIEQRTKFLLVQHENHPTLNEILLVLKRIRSFSIENSLMKYLFAFDLLLSKMNYWQQTFASRTLRTTFDEQMKILTEKIIEFRRFENENSSQTFSMIEFEERRETIHRWFFLFFEFIRSNNEQQIEENLHQFFRRSTLGDLKIRLEICQIFEQFSFSSKLIAIRFYYEQFVEYFQNQIEKQRQPIENELKEFLRIQRWKDTNYFSLKNSIDKSKKFLFKSMKNYRKILRQSAENYFFSFEFPQRSNLITKTDEFFRRIRTNFNRKIYSIVDFRSSMIETKIFFELCSTISSMKILTNDRKESKQIFSEKRQLLTQLFHRLTSIGFSHRKGLTNVQRENIFSPIQFSFLRSTIQIDRYGTISTRKRTLFIENRDEILTKFVDLLQQTNRFYSNLIFQNENFRILSTKSKFDPVLSERIRGFQQHSFEFVRQQRIFFDEFLNKFQRFSREFSFYSSICSSSNNVVNLNQIEILFDKTIFLIERTKYFQFIFESIRRENEENSIDVPQFDSPPKYFQLIKTNEIDEFIREFLQQLNELLMKINEFSQHRLVRHRHGEEIRSLHQQIAENFENFQKIFNEIFIDEIRFPNEKFFADEIRNLFQIYREFASIDIVERNPSEWKIKSIRRYKINFIRSFNELSTGEEISIENIWKIFHLFRQISNKFDLEHLTSLISKTISTKTIGFFRDIHLLIEQILFRFIYFHRCSLELSFLLGQTFLQLMKEGFQLPPDEQEDQQNENQQDNQGVSGMDEGQIGENARDVSDQIETEDQLEQTKMPDEKQQDEDEDEKENDEKIQNEENGIEVSFDFDGKLDDVEENKSDDENDQSEDEDEEENLDDQMGDVNDEDQGETFDEEKWQNEDEKEKNQSEKDKGKNQEKQEEFKAKDQQLDLIDQDDDDDENRPATPQPTIEQGNEQNNDNDHENQSDLELPENLNLDDGEENRDEDREDQEEEEEEQMNDEMMTFEDRKEEENFDQTNTKDQSIENIDEEATNDEPKEESALTKDQKNLTETTPMEQRDDLKTPFANAETFEKEQNISNETVGESTSKKNSIENERISSNDEQQNQFNENSTNPKDSSKQNEKSKSNDQRTLSEILSKLDEKIQAALDLDDKIDENNDQDEQTTIDDDREETQLYAHAKNISSTNEQQKQILDSATNEQREQIQDENQLEKQSEVNEPMIIDNPIDEKSNENKSQFDKNSTKKKSNSTKNSKTQNEEKQEEEMFVDENKPFISTSTVEQQIDYVAKLRIDSTSNDLTEQIEYQLEEWYTNDHNDQTKESIDAELLWSHLENLTQPFVFELCEQLRLLLEPTQRTKYSGDYRTGKRLNMKRIIPYIASDFRKDRIWLRRLKPSKREYQLILAIDDSQSMDNLQVKRLALESLILLGQTLNLLDIGQFGIVSFGQFIRTLQPLSQTFNHQNGIEILKELKFNQTKTLLAELMESVTHTFSQERRPSGNLFSQLLIILSDGRGLTVSGKDRLLKSVRHAMAQNIFVVFIILDNLNHEKSTSIFQINEAVFLGDKVEFRSYLESFPFPYYLVIQNLEMLPRALIDVLRQFLELTTTNQHNHQ